LNSSWGFGSPATLLLSRWLPYISAAAAIPVLEEIKLEEIRLEETLKMVANLAGPIQDDMQNKKPLGREAFVKTNPVPVS
jgi:hypothetical protein